MAHFVLFVFACIEIDMQIRKESNVVFLPVETENPYEDAPAPVSSMRELIWPHKLPVARVENDQSQYASGLDGTLWVPRDRVAN